MKTSLSIITALTMGSIASHAQYAPIDLSCADATTVASYSYPTNPQSWLDGTGYYDPFNAYASGPCADAGPLTYNGTAGHSKGSLVDGVGMICSGAWGSSYQPDAGNNLSFDVDFAADASGNLDTFCFDWSPFNGAAPPEGFELSVNDSNGNTLWSSGQQQFIGGVAGQNNTECFDISSVQVTGGETLTFETYVWGTSVFLGGFEVSSDGALCVCPEPSAALLALLGGAGFFFRRRR